MSAQHEKTWVFDETLWVCGSANATENSFTKCEEAVVFSRSEEMLRSLIGHHRRIWEDSEEVDWAALEAKEAEARANREAKEAERVALRAAKQPPRSRRPSVAVG